MINMPNQGDPGNGSRGSRRSGHCPRHVRTSHGCTESRRRGLFGLRGNAPGRPRFGAPVCRRTRSQSRPRTTPTLTTLTAAVSGQLNPQVNLVDTLNSGQYTVFAPTDAAFSKLPAATINELKTNSDMLKSILTYHVVPGQLSPAQVDGSHPSVQGAPVNVTGSGNGLKVNNAGLVCGGVPTANAQVYMIDTVLMPPGH